MSIFRQSTTIEPVSATSIGTYAAVVAGNVPLPQGGPIYFINKGYASSIIISSGADISAATFTITGTYNNRYVTETITGPNATVAITNNLFHTVNSITASANIAQAYTIGSNFNVAVVLNTYNTRNATNFNLSSYSILINSLTANAQWDAGEAVIYGVSGQMPITLTSATLDYDTRSVNLFAINDVAVAITQAQLNAGFITDTNYPFSGIIVYFTNGVISTPSFVEIAQS